MKVSELIEKNRSTLDIQQNDFLLDIIEAINYKDIEADGITDIHDLQEILDYDGTLHSLIDSKIEIYYYQLRAWAVENYDKIEEAMAEGLCEGVTDFHQLIQSGQYVAYREECYDAVELIFELIEEDI